MRLKLHSVLDAVLQNCMDANISPDLLCLTLQARHCISHDEYDLVQSKITNTGKLLVNLKFSG